MKAMVATLIYFFTLTLAFARQGQVAYELVNLENKVNSKYFDSALIIAPDGKTLLNTAGFDAYYTVADTDTLVFTTCAFMSADGDHLDIYSLKQVVKVEPSLFLAGFVYNEKTFDPVKANIRFEKEGQVLKTEQSKPEYGEYRTRMPEGGKYILRVSAEGYLSTVDSVELEDVLEDTEIFKDLYLQPLEVGMSVRLNNIFFDYNQTTLRQESFPELDRVVELMEQNPQLKIEIGGHTDGQGSEEYNHHLSQGRAAAVRKYLLQHWIDSERVTAVGYGESQPEVPNDTEENMQTNRRVAFTVLKKE